MKSLPIPLYPLRHLRRHIHSRCSWGLGRHRPRRFLLSLRPPGRRHNHMNFRVNPLRPRRHSFRSHHRRHLSNSFHRRRPHRRPRRYRRHHHRQQPRLRRSASTG